MTLTLPPDSAAFMSGAWSDIAPYYHELEDRVVDPGNLETYLADWTALAERVDDAATRLRVATTRDTADKTAEERYTTFLEAVYPHVEAAEQALKEKLLASGMEPAGFAVPLRNMRQEAELFREENLPLQTEEEKLSTRFYAVTGAQTVTWEGRELPIDGLLPFYQDPDRAVRERAWRLEMERRLADRAALNELWSAFLDVRRRQAANAGFPDYRAYRWRQLMRFDYTPDDCLRFHAAIEEVVVPVARRLREERRRQLGVATLRPWDTKVDPQNLPPLRPFEDVATLEERTAAIVEHLDPRFGAYITAMRDGGLLDLDNRKNKAPGGYCCSFSATWQPFIFMNAVGVHNDVQTLLHEGGHAFHVFETAPLPYLQQRHPGAEFAEVASMSMELLARRT